MATELVEDDAELIAGRRPVEEAFAARRPARRLLVVPQRRAALEQIVLHATTLRLPVVEVEGGTLTSVAGFDGHQGVALVVEPRRWATLDELVARARERGEAPFVVVLDSLEDPQNLGTLLRAAEAAGAHGAVFPTRRAAPLSPAAVKASAGAVEHLLLVPVDDLAGALADLHVRGLRLVGAEADAPLTYREADLRGPLALVVGSEGHGLSGTVRRRLDQSVRIPMSGRVASLNAAVAGSILLFEAAGQRGLAESSVGTAPAPDTESPPLDTEAVAAPEPPPETEAMVEAPAAEAAPEAPPQAGATPEAPARATRKKPAAPASPDLGEPREAAQEPVKPKRARAKAQKAAEQPADGEELLPGEPPATDEA